MQSISVFLDITKIADFSGFFAPPSVSSTEKDHTE